MPEILTCLTIDSQDTLTTFSRAEETDRPEKVRPGGIGADVVVYYADISMDPKDAIATIGDIQSQWQKGDAAVFEQWEGGQPYQALILGYTLVQKGGRKSLSQIRIFTPW